jgi:hypothetical protein
MADVYGTSCIKKNVMCSGHALREACATTHGTTCEPIKPMDKNKFQIKQKYNKKGKRKVRV